MVKYPYSKCISLSIIGFTIGGFLWGLIGIFCPDPYRTMIFGPIGGFIFGLVGGLFLSILSTNKKPKIIIYAAIGYAISGVVILTSLGIFVFTPLAVIPHIPHILI